ncbi:SEFIR domain-containing protein [Amycolatopsis sp. H20-H5]|uniref:SEFIR domain-containing protein n=1 Tax=Amycolatopsis sp. H20-H5 TaxID=3046309 RepID=UPI002DBD2AA8|nr:SEFIR domain-containing protein [Amycolatopsis sp. H20-H5]MEC3980488.1 SEFIR domain-containing protein [Amycolatopsis sp. H20-H5]
MSTYQEEAVAGSGAGQSPRVFITYSHESEQHKKLVREFATFLRTEVGVDAHLDQWADDGRRDWSLWAIEQLTEADFVLVIASPDYKRRAEGRAAPAEGRGAQFEAAMIRDNITQDLPRTAKARSSSVTSM